MATKQKGDFKGNVIGFLLFSSMLDPAGEIYLSREAEDKAKTIKRSLKSLRVNISNTLDKKINLFRQDKTAPSIDAEIEMAMEDIGTPQASTIDELFAEEETKETPQEIKSAFKDVYSVFVGYAKSAYSAINYGKKKIIEGPVRITMAKFIKLFEYILAALNPQWNMPMLSKMDFDTLSPAVANHIIISKDNYQYGSGYSALRYSN